MGYGVSEAIRLAAGPAIEDEVRRFVPVRPGRAVVTSFGNHPTIRFIFHGVTVGYDVDKKIVFPSRDLIAEIMSCCFYHADTLQLRSLAFPLFGTGAQGFPKGDCLDTMFQFLVRMFLRGLTPVTEARVVLFG
jgi:O-acetyl-ADP-ribose deacetylase (regulator of RNase III)